MTTLKSRIMRAAEFDEHKWRPIGFTFESDAIAAAKIENSQLRPLIEALADLVDCAKTIDDELENSRNRPMFVNLAESLANLERVVGGER